MAHTCVETCCSPCRNWSGNVRCATEFFFLLAVFVLEQCSMLLVTLHVCSTFIARQS
jgi:hypothetical protein